MEKEINIEQLKSSDETEALMVLFHAFAENGSSTHAAQSKVLRAIRRLVNALPGLFGQRMGLRAKLGLWGGFANYNMYGIRQDGKLICVAVFYNAEKRPPILLIIMGFFISVIFRAGRLLRRQFAIEVERICAEMPKHYWKDQYMNLTSFGTLPAYQKQGLGREMLRFICRVAESKGFAGIQLLATGRDSPAFHLYIKEGFIAENDLNIASEVVVPMQLTFLKEPC
jgi:ribosomal protein S18 acetylase RimI-like enzyme